MNRKGPFSILRPVKSKPIVESKDETKENELKELYSKKNKLFSQFGKLFNTYLIQKQAIDDEIKNFILDLLKLPLIAAIMAWGENMKSIDPEIPSDLETLIMDKKLPIYTSEGKEVPLGKVIDFDHNQIVNEIRGSRELGHFRKEKLVSTYISFIDWLAGQTYNYIPPFNDPDKLKRQGRALDFSLFIKFLDYLDDKSQLVAKLLYFGGSRTLDDILGLKLEDINFEDLNVRFGTHIVRYPVHLFYDMQALAQNRTTGRLFLGRQNSPLNPATIFRKFKEAGFQAGLGEHVSPKSLTTNT